MNASSSSRQYQGHRRPWWQFNVIPLFVVLFAMVWWRHLADLSQVASMSLTVAIVIGWILLGAGGLYVRAARQARGWKRVRLIVYAAIPILGGAVLCYRSHRQAELLENVWGRRNLRPNVTFAEHISVSMVRKDRSFRRYWGQVTGIQLREHPVEPPLLKSLAIFNGLESLTCTIDGQGVDEVARLGNLKSLTLSIHGPADYSPLRKLDRLRRLSIHWARWSSQDSSLASLSGLPIRHLTLRDGPPLTQQEIGILCSLPLQTLDLAETHHAWGSLIDTAGLNRLQQALPNTTIVPQSIADAAGEQGLLSQLRRRDVSFRANHLGRVSRLDIRAGTWTPADIRLLAQLSDLEELKFHNSTLNGPVFAALADIENLKSLHLEECNVPPGTWQELGQIDQVQDLRLEELVLSTDRMSQLSQLDQLEKLELRMQGIPPDQLDLLLELTSLTELELRGMPLTPNDLAALAKHPTLATLKLWRNDLYPPSHRMWRTKFPKLKLEFQGKR